MNFITVKEAAEQKGCTDRLIRKAIADGRLRARKYGWQWLIFDNKQYRQFQPQALGRPRKSSTAKDTKAKKQKDGEQS